ncbi:MAG: hypothetical protein LBI45_07240 [Bacteroidales bacterium]|jgi:hypothetical protein|nr:hypothetical protein [Bacteroidales bacterium]
MAQITNKDRTTLADMITNTQYFAAYPKRLRVNTNKNNTGLLQDLINKYWSYLIQKTEVGGTGKERFVRTYHVSVGDRDKFMSEIQEIKRSGYLSESDEDGYLEDQDGNLHKDDGTLRKKTLEDEKQQLFSGISNGTLIIGALVVAGIILVLFKQKK